MSILPVPIVIEVFNHIGQVLLLLFLAPFLSWILENLPRLLFGLSIAPLRLIYQRCWAFVKESLCDGMPMHEGLCVAVCLTVLLITPGFSCLGGADAGEAMARLADVLLVGSLLLLGGGCLCFGLSTSAYIGLVVVLCLTEALLVLAAPGISVFLGGAHVVRLLPDSGLLGTSACCALALVILVPLPNSSLLEARWWQPVDHYRISCERRAVLMMFLQMGWLLFLGDLFLPGFVGGVGILGLLGLFFRLAVMVVVVVLLRLLGGERHPHLVALLVGLGFLFALAGRFAT